MWQMIGILADLEGSLIIERTRVGMQTARARGVKPGRKLIGAGEFRQYVADLLNVGRVTLYRRLKD